MIHDEAQAFLAGVDARMAAGRGVEGLGSALERAAQLISPSLRVARWQLGQAEFYRYFDMGFRFDAEAAQ